MSDAMSEIARWQREEERQLELLKKAHKFSPKLSNEVKSLDGTLNNLREIKNKIENTMNRVVNRIDDLEKEMIDKYNHK